MCCVCVLSCEAMCLPLRPPFMCCYAAKGSVKACYVKDVGPSERKRACLCVLAALSLGMDHLSSLSGHSSRPNGLQGLVSIPHACMQGVCVCV